MINLALESAVGRPLRLLAVGAHPDDVEIGAGGTLLLLAGRYVGLQARVVVLTGTEERAVEAKAAATDFLPGAELSVAVHSLPDGMLPAHWQEAKDLLREAASFAPDLVLAPPLHDAHQDHRLVAELLPQVLRDALVLGYEIPKWDGDLARPSVYVPLPESVVRRKSELLHEHYRSQHGKDWFDDEVFRGVARLRGVECRSRYAEAFTCTKATLDLGG